jgi:hypothetical protein
VPLTARLRGLPKPPGQSGETGLTRANQTPAAEQAPSGDPDGNVVRFGSPIADP